MDTVDKNKKIFAIVIVVVLVVFLTCTILRILSNNRQAISSTKFSSIMQNLGYSVLEDTISEGISGVEECYIASSANGDYQIEFRKFDTETSAVNFYLTNRNYLSSYGGEEAKNKYYVGNTYLTFERISDTAYGVVGRVKNTTIYVDATSTNSVEIKKAIKKLKFF